MGRGVFKWPLTTCNSGWFFPLTNEENEIYIKSSIVKWELKCVFDIVGMKEPLTTCNFGWFSYQNVARASYLNLILFFLIVDKWPLSFSL